jgi:TatD DNase family protein
MIIDTHCHINNECYEDLNKILENAKNNNVLKMVCVGFDKETNIKALEIANKYDNVYATVGIHPCDCDIEEEYFNTIEEYIKNNKKIIAIGETGLDYYWQKDNKEIQKKYFIKQIELAIKYNLPIIVHSRDSIGDIYDILKEYKNKVTGIMHCYSSSLEMAKLFIDLGFYISFAGPITFKNNKTSANIIKNLDINRLLVETDCPFLTPEPFRGKQNEPSYVKYTFSKMAEILEINEKELENILEQNFNRLFNI